jgi:hypothetical protein
MLSSYWLDLKLCTASTKTAIYWTVELGDVQNKIGDRVAIQGNLDPAVLYASPEVIETEVKREIMVIKTLHSSKLKIEQNEFSLTPGMNSGAPEGWTIPAPLVAPIVLNLG